MLTACGIPSPVILLSVAHLMAASTCRWSKVRADSLPPNMVLNRNIAFSARLCRLQPLDVRQTYRPCTPIARRVVSRATRHLGRSAPVLASPGPSRHDGCDSAAGQYGVVCGTRIVAPVPRDLSDGAGDQREPATQHASRSNSRARPGHRRGDRQIPSKPASFMGHIWVVMECPSG